MILIIVLLYLFIGISTALICSYICKENNHDVPVILFWPLVFAAGILYVLAKMGEVVESFIRRWILK